MVDQFTSVEVFENEIGLTLRALEDLSAQESAVEIRYSKLEDECKRAFESRKREAEKKRLSEVSAAKGRRTEQEQKAHGQFDSDLKELTVARRNRVAATGKERERRRLTLETSHDWQVNELRQHASEEENKLQEPVVEAQVVAENKIAAFSETFKREYDMHLLNDVKDYLIQIKRLRGAIMAEGHRLEQERQQIVKRTSDLLASESKNAEEIRKLAGEIDAYVQGVPRTFNEHSALHTPFRLNRSHNALPAPFNSTAEAHNQVQSCHAAVADIYTRLLSLNNEVDENRGKAIAIVGGGCLIILIIVFLGWLLFSTAK